MSSRPYSRTADARVHTPNKSQMRNHCVGHSSSGMLDGVPERITEVTAFLAEMLAPRAPLTVIVDGGDHGAAAAFAARLAAAFPPSARAWSVDAVLGLTGPAGDAFDSALNVLEPATDQVIVYLRSGPGRRS